MTSYRNGIIASQLQRSTMWLDGKAYVHQQTVVYWIHEDCFLEQNPVRRAPG